ncbi:MAG: DUF5063 domain-containing protein [Bacteroidales bacterium]|nr:DUF5063 domain-containing protein [Bacteroidales bacterium]MDD3281056.1 DUF5063 domain-containing protein [Bacteroidales bacterium]MDD4208846.1 DUF5063 domain-containing protein [Bacteroidales bacterium]
MDIEKIVDAPNTKDILLVANQYTTFVEKINLFEPFDAMDYSLKIIPLLYIKGLLIPAVEPEEDDILASRFLTEEDYEITYVNVKDKFEKYNYFESFDSLTNQMETYDMSEMITDIYQDMKDFILLYQKNTFTAQINAVRNLRQNFYERWGKTIVVLLSYLHPLLYPMEANPAEEID